jgi:hypothetical protein
MSSNDLERVLVTLRYDNCVLATVGRNYNSNMHKYCYALSPTDLKSTVSMKRAHQQKRFPHIDQ